MLSLLGIHLKIYEKKMAVQFCFNAPFERKQPSSKQKMDS